MRSKGLLVVFALVAAAAAGWLALGAEGVETEDQLRLLRKLECENGQGYLFSTPLGGNQLEQFIANCNLEAPTAMVA